jgi:predicted NACHT family NTPase
VCARLQADPGAGKSFLLHRLALLWAIGHRSMSTFDLVVLVPYREVVSSMKEKIVEKYDTHESNSEKLSTWLSTDSKRILLLFDGFDELALADKGRSSFRFCESLSIELEDSCL